MYCPIRPNHRMTEVAPDLFQCAHCGYGPSQTGHRPFWAISNVETEGCLIEATSTRWDSQLDCYVMTLVSWEIDENGKRVPQTFEEEESLILSTPAELEDAPLPVVIRAKGKWDYPAAKPPLRTGMFPDQAGLKEIALSNARAGRSSSAPSPA